MRCCRERCSEQRCPPSAHGRSAVRERNRRVTPSRNAPNDASTSAVTVKRLYRHQTAMFKSSVTRSSHHRCRTVTSGSAARRHDTGPWPLASDRAHRCRPARRRWGVPVHGGHAQVAGTARRHVRGRATRSITPSPARSDRWSSSPGAVDLARAADLGHACRVTTAGGQDGQATSVARRRCRSPPSCGADAVVAGAGRSAVRPDRGVAAGGRAPAAEHQIVVASYDGRRGPHPVRLHRSLWAMLPSTGDDGARTLIREHPALVHEVPCPGSAADIDTLEDLQRWTSS